MMLKALMKKQFLELNQFYFQSRKTGKRRSRGGIIGTVIGYAAIFLFISVSVGVLAATLAASMLPAGLDWLYFAILGLLAVFLGVFGGVFNTYATLYNAKDNELLLSMPVPPGKILLSRMFGVYLMGLMYEAIVFVPTVIVYWIMGSPTALAVIFQILLVFLIGVFVLTLTCALGWLVALIASRIHNKSFITVLFSLAFFAVYYVVYFKASAYLQEIGLHLQEISDTMRGGLYPFYALGQAASGKVLPMVLVTLVILGLFALTWFILARSFRRIVTANRGEKKAVYKEKEVKTTSAQSALLHKEFKRLTSSPTYMLNCALGVILMPILAVVALIKMPAIREIVGSFSAAVPEVADLIAVCICGIMVLLAGMNVLTAPSISLEGKNLWIVQSMPVEPMDALSAKIKMHRILSIIPAALCTAVLCFVLKVEVSTAIILLVTVALFNMLNADFGLVLNLRNPNLTWTNEAVPVKQSITVLIMMLGSMVLGIVLVVVYYFLREKLSAGTYLTILMVAFAFVTRWLDSWIRKKGTVIFKNL